MSLEPLVENAVEKISKQSSAPVTRSVTSTLLEEYTGDSCAEADSLVALEPMVKNAVAEISDPEARSVASTLTKNESKNARRKLAKATKAAAERAARAAVHEERLRTAVPHDVADSLLEKVCSFDTLVHFFRECGRNILSESGDVDCCFMYARGEFNTDWCSETSVDGVDEFMAAAGRVAGLLP